MQTVDIDGAEVAYRLTGHGAPLILIHAAGLADFFKPLEDTELGNRYQVISYHRIGYGQSCPAPPDTQISDQAHHCQRLLQHLGHRSAHVVGHSSGGVIALELARRSPSTVATLALLEPSLPVPSSASLATSVMQPAFAAYLAGDKATAVDTFLAGVCGPEYPDLIDRTLPVGARQQAARDADTLFAVEAPSVGRWGFDPEWLTALTMPVLSVLGARSDEVSPVSSQAHRLLLEHVPQIEGYLLPGATHFLHVQNANQLAAALHEFIEHHPALDGITRN